MSELGGRLGFVAVGALIAYLLLPSEPITYTDVIVPAARIIEREPPARPPTIIERVVYKFPPPVQVATAPGGARDVVGAFCRPTVIALTDTVQVTDTLLLFHAGVHTEAPLWNPFARDELLLTGPTSTGDLRSIDVPVRGGFDFRASGDSALVRYPRTAAVRDLIETGAVLYTAFDLLLQLRKE